MQENIIKFRNEISSLPPKDSLDNDFSQKVALMQEYKNQMTPLEVEYKQYIQKKTNKESKTESKLKNLFVKKEKYRKEIDVLIPKIEALEVQLEELKTKYALARDEKENVQSILMTLQNKESQLSTLVAQFEILQKHYQMLV